jgi:hypothetical protein
LVFKFLFSERRLQRVTKLTARFAVPESVAHFIIHAVYAVVNIGAVAPNPFSYLGRGASTKITRRRGKAPEVFEGNIKNQTPESGSTFVIGV